MALQFPSMPQPHQPSPDGLSNILFKVAAEKRAREEEARRMLLDQTRMQHEQQRMDQQDRISRTKDSLALNREMQGTLTQGLPLLRDRPDQARALFAGHNAAIGNLPPEMQGGLRIDLPPPGPPPQNPGPAPQPGPAPIPQEGPPQQRAYAPSPSMQPAGAEQVDHPEAVRLDEPPPEGPDTLGDQVARSAMIPVEMQMDRAERAKLAASNQQAQDQYAQAEAAKQADYQKQREAYENPSYEIGIGDQKVTYHQREIERAEAQKNADLAQRWGQSMLPAVGNDEMARQFVGITQAELSLTGNADKAAAAFNLFLGADIKARAVMLEHAKKSARDAEMLQIAHQNANSKSRIATVAEQTYGLKEHEEPLREATRAETSANGFLQKQGYTAKLSEARSLADAMANFVAHGGAALDTAAAVSFANRVQQKGLLTDKDFDLFWKSIGGPAERVGDTFQKLINGEMGEKRRQGAIKAMDQLAANAQRSLSATAVGLHRYLSHYGGSDGERERIMESHFPRKDYGNAYPTEEEAAVAPDAAAAPPAKGARSPGADDITGAAKAHRDKRRPNAPPPKKPPRPKAENWFDE